MIISIHAPRVGSDLDDMVGKTVTIEFQSTLPVWGATNGSVGYKLGDKISIHAPRVGSDLLKGSAGLNLRLFQSTLPVWGATIKYKKG